MQKFTTMSLSIFCFFILLQSAFAKNQIPVVVYYDYMPYYNAQKEDDLTRAFVKVLNQGIATADLEFISTYVPKGRLDVWLKNSKWQGVVVWTNPKFVNDEQKEKYIWSNTLFTELDLVASNAKRPVDYTKTDDLIGKTLGTVVNQRYADVEELIQQNKIKRHSTVDQEANIKMLMAQRVDVVFISRSTISYFKTRIPNFPQYLYFAKTPRNTFSRHIMLTKAIPAPLQQKILHEIEVISKDKTWKTKFDQLEPNPVF